MNLNRLIKLCFASITFDLLSIQAPGIISAEFTACMRKDVYVCIQQKRFRYCPLTQAQRFVDVYVRNKYVSRQPNLQHPINRT